MTLDRLELAKLASYVAAFFLLFGCKTERSSTDTTGRAPSSEAVAPKPQSYPTAPLVPGAQVFDFSALAHNGQELRLSDYLEKPVVVYFCPQDVLPACTSLAASVRDAWTDLHSQVDMVYGVSPEPTIVHREFAADNHLTHLLLSDGDGTLHRVFGIAPTSVVAYLIGTDRTILHVFSTPNPAGFGAEILATLAAKGLTRPTYPI